MGEILDFFPGTQENYIEIHEPRKKTLTFHYYWLFNRDPCNGSLYSPYDW